MSCDVLTSRRELERPYTSTTSNSLGSLTCTQTRRYREMIESHRVVVTLATARTAQTHLSAQVDAVMQQSARTTTPTSRQYEHRVNCVIRCTCGSSPNVWKKCAQLHFRSQLSLRTSLVYLSTLIIEIQQKMKINRTDFDNNFHKYLPY